jgi:hypothetical protein
MCSSSKRRHSMIGNDCLEEGERERERRQWEPQKRHTKLQDPELEKKRPLSGTRSKNRIAAAQKSGNGKPQAHRTLGKW